MANLTTLTDVKILLNIPSSDTSQDAQLNLLIASISSQIESYCGRKFEYQEYIEVLAANNRQLLQLKQWPIVDLETVKQSGNTLVAGVDYQVYAQYSESGQIYRGIGWTGPDWVRGLTADPFAGEFIYEATYLAGYLLPGVVLDPVPDPLPDNLPLDIQLCAQQMVAKMYGLSQAQNLGGNLASIKEGGLAYSWNNADSGQSSSDMFGVNAGMPSQFAQILNAYRRWVNA